MATQWKSSCRVQERRSTCRYCWYSCLFGWYWSHFLCLNRSLTLRDTLLTLWWTLTRTSRWLRISFFQTVLKTGCMGSDLPLLSYLVLNCIMWKKTVGLSCLDLSLNVLTPGWWLVTQGDGFFIKGWWPGRSSFILTMRVRQRVRRRGFGSRCTLGEIVFFFCTLGELVSSIGSSFADDAFFSMHAVSWMLGREP